MTRKQRILLQIGRDMTRKERIFFIRTFFIGIAFLVFLLEVVALGLLLPYVDKF